MLIKIFLLETFNETYLSYVALGNIGITSKCTFILNIQTPTSLYQKLNYANW